MNESSQFMSSKQTAEYLNLSLQTLYNWRSAGFGPRGIRFGRVLRYRLGDVQKWVEEQERSAA